VKSSCEFGNELSGSIKCWEFTSTGLTIDYLSSSAQLHTVMFVTRCNEHDTYGLQTIHPEMPDNHCIIRRYIKLLMFMFPDTAGISMQ
jgi:hypothetical protein